MMNLACMLLAFLPCATSPEAEGVSSDGLMRWIDACERQIDSMHGFVFLRHGKVVAEGSWKPYDTLNETHRLSSHSKCFVTTAVGFLVEEGKLDLDEPVVNILPDKIPAQPSLNLQRLRVRDLMTMTLGSSRSEAWRNDIDGDWLKAILGNEIDRTPGTAFLYDSGATHVLGAVVERKSGMGLMAFLKQRLFGRIGIEKAWCTHDPTGVACGAWGMNMTTREISLIGQLYLNRGVWNGERLLSEAWTTLAMTKQTHSGRDFNDRHPQGLNDWLHGFGFNFWRCQHGYCRADGSGGQFTFIFPDKDAVLSINSDVNDMQKVMDVVWEHFLPVFANAAALPENPSAAAKLKARCEGLALVPLAGRREGGDACCGTYFPFKTAPSWLKGALVSRTDEGWSIRLTTDAGDYALPVGYGKWALGTCVFSPRQHEPLGVLIGRQRIAASAAVQPDGALRVRLHQLDGMRRIELDFASCCGTNCVKGTVAGQGLVSSL